MSWSPRLNRLRWPATTLAARAAATAVSLGCCAGYPSTTMPAAPLAGPSDRTNPVDETVIGFALPRTTNPARPSTLTQSPPTVCVAGTVAAVRQVDPSTED